MSLFPLVLCHCYPLCFVTVNLVPCYFYHLCCVTVTLYCTHANVITDEIYFTHDSNFTTAEVKKTARFTCSVAGAIGDVVFSWYDGALELKNDTKYMITSLVCLCVGMCVCQCVCARARACVCMCVCVCQCLHVIITSLHYK